MTESQINCLEAAAKFRNFSKAAKFLMISQPAISHQISKLEQELGFLLFDRTGKDIKLTEAGSMILDFLSRTKSEFTQLIDTIIASQQTFHGDLRLGCPEGWDITPFLPSLVNVFQGDHPKIRVEMVGLPLGEIESALLNGDIHAAVTLNYTISERHGLFTHPMTSANSVLIYPKDFPAPEGKQLTLADFRNSVFFMSASSENATFRQAILDECQKYQFAPKVVNCPSLSTALFCVQNNQGVLLGSELMLAKHLSHLYSHLTIDNSSRSVVLAWNQPDSEDSPLHLFLNEILYQKKSDDAAVPAASL